VTPERKILRRTPILKEDRLIKKLAREAEAGAEADRPECNTQSL
jgi:hypothetical protein